MSYYEERTKLAEEILRLSRRRISGANPLLLTSLYAMDDVAREEGVEMPLSTNGAHIFYSPEQVVEDFRQNSDSVAQQLLHIVCHCLLGHLPARDGVENLEVFDGVADYQVNRFEHLLCPRLGWGEEDDCPAWENTSRLCHMVEERWDREAWLEENEHCYMDDHDLWAMPSPPKSGGGFFMEMGDWDGILKEMGRQSQEMERKKKGSGRFAGDSLGDSIQKIFAQRETAVSYREILQELLTVAEQERVDVQSIDPVWYHLGRELLDGVPMIEPLESGETQAVMDLVVAIDTSGSCEGDICRRFIQELAGLLSDVEQEGMRYRVLLLQCDTEIQQEVLVESREDIEALGENFEPCGFGGTNFEPVFKRIAHRQEDGTLNKVQGLVYFSDGWGSFPQTEPDYPTIFVLYDSDGAPNWNIPPWVQGVGLTETELVR